MTVSEVPWLLTTSGTVPAMTSVVIKLGVVQGPNPGTSVLLTIICVSLSPVRGEPPERPHRGSLTLGAATVSDMTPVFNQQIIIQCPFVLRTLWGLGPFHGPFPQSCFGAFSSNWICKLYLYKTSDCQEFSPQSLQKLYKSP